MIVMGRVALRDGLDVQGAKATMAAEMAAGRLARVTVGFQMPRRLSEADRSKLEKAAETCPIYQALKPVVQVVVNVVWPS